MKSKEQAQQDAGARISQSAAIRARHRTQLSHPLGQIVVDTPDRVLKRLARLKRYASDAAILESTSTGVPSDTSERLVEIQELEEAVTRVLLDEPNSAAAAPSRVARSAAPGNVAADHDEMQRFQRRVAAAVGVPSTAAAASPRQPRGAAPPAAKMQSPDASGAGARSGSGDAPSTDAASRQGTLAIALERVFFSNAFLDISYLSRGVTAEEAVVHIQWDRGGTRSYGTGFLVAPGIVLTNEHVLPERELADIARIRFRYEEPDEGAVSAIISTRSVPEQLFLTSTMLGRPELDFTLVAVNTDDVRFQQIAPLALIAAEGKAVMGDHLTVVQHPNGGFKRIALRNNSLAAVLDTFLHYETGTEGGSSGSPVFNDQWEVVALHHASVRTDREQFEGWVNEGVRVSSLIAALQGALSDADRVMPAVASPHRARLQALVTRATAGTVSRPATPTAKPISDVLQPANVTPLETRDERTFLGPTRADQRTMVDELSSPPTLAAGAAAETSLTVPLTITVRLGTIGAPTAVPAAPPPPSRSAPSFESLRIERDYTRRNGYSPAFLGRSDTLRVALPDVSALGGDVLRDINGAPSEASYELRYYNFSVIMHARRRLAICTAVNIDGRQLWDLGKRTNDQWAFDTRLDSTLQLEESFYDGNAFDKGHLVRRLDPVWGRTEDRALRANKDTFHLTNCSPQHEAFNRGRAVWLGLEDHVLNSAFAHELKVSVFAGPVLRRTDPAFRGVRIPLEYWKVVVMRYDDALWSTAYRLSQQHLIDEMEWEAATTADPFTFGEYRTYQVSVAEVEKLTKLNFGPLRTHDALGRGHPASSDVVNESRTRTVRPLDRVEDMVL